MSLSFTKSLAQHLEQLVVGPPAYDRHGRVANMVVCPLFPSRLLADPPDMITLSEALDKGVSLSDTGLVNRVHLDNPLPTSILVGESEILMGPTQQRSVQHSCLIAPQRRVALPVSCVEEARPTMYQAQFTAADACPWFVRSFKMEQMARLGEPPQYWVWDHVKTYLSNAQVESDTRAVHSVLDRHSFQLHSLSSAFPRHSGQVGAICAVGQNLFIELFGDPEIFEDRYDQVLRSALVEALAHPSDQVVPPERIQAFFSQLVEASQKSRVLQSRSLKDSGRCVAFSDRGINGSALVADGRLVHLAAHQKCLGYSSSFASLQPILEKARAAWETERPLFLDQVQEDYDRRRRRYNDFKARLRFVPPAYASPEKPFSAAAFPEDSPPALPPLPLNRALHDFFMHLFRRD